MGWVSKKAWNRHACEAPELDWGTDAVNGDVWKCDECGALWVVDFKENWKPRLRRMNAAGAKLVGLAERMMESQWYKARAARTGDPKRSSEQKLADPSSVADASTIKRVNDSTGGE